MTKNCKLSIASKTNAIRAKSFHIYRNGINCKSKLSFFLRASIKEFKPLRKKILKKKKKIFCILIRSKQWVLRLDGSQRKFVDNSVLVMKKNLEPLSKYTKGPTLIEFKRKKLLTFFKNVY